jgi:hypothetical protein
MGAQPALSAALARTRAFSSAPMLPTSRYTATAVPTRGGGLASLGIRAESLELPCPLVGCDGKLPRREAISPGRPLGLDAACIAYRVLRATVRVAGLTPFASSEGSDRTHGGPVRRPVCRQGHRSSRLQVRPANARRGAASRAACSTASARTPRRTERRRPASARPRRPRELCLVPGCLLSRLKYTSRSLGDGAG